MALGTLEASRFAAGRKNGQNIEINGEKGSIRFSLERLNEMEVFWVGSQPKETQGFTNVLVSEGYHPWWEKLVAAGTHDRRSTPSSTRSHTCSTALSTTNP